jgi:cell wall-associated NlpC family hydrolase
MADFSDLIGVPFAYGGRGPDALDCYGLVMECARRDGVELPDFGSSENQAEIMAMMLASLPQWREIECRPGAVVFMRVARSTHVGYMVDANHMLHAWENSGGPTRVRVDEWKHRILGFYEYVGKDQAPE